MSTSPDTPATDDHVTIYATSWCPFCAKLITALRSRGVPFTAWDVEKHPDLAEWVESVNDGDRIVPTVRYSDGGHATNPSPVEVERRYKELVGA